MPEAVSRFLREASAAGRIGSRHIVETFDAGQLPSGEPYLVMELLRGETLADRLEREGALPIDAALEIVRQAAIGIHAAHEAGIVHRDLKPENLFLVGGDEPLVKILDFGISKFDPELTGTPSLTTDGSTLGTPYYMAPEQVRGGQVVDARSDVYALGVVLYECLIGKPPFVADTLPALCVLIHEGEYQRPRALRPELTTEVEAIVVRAIEGDRERRYQSARELAEALARLGVGPLSLRETLAVSSDAATVRQASAPAYSVAPPAAHGTLEPGTKTAISPELPAAPSRGRRALMIAGGALLFALALGLLWNANRAASTSTPELEKLASPAPSEPPRAVEPAPSPTPSTPPPAPEPSALSAPAPKTAPPTSRSATPSTKPGSTGSRAKEHGLGTRDPFGP